ncbi:MAG: hypothetical protein ACK4XK_00185 [Casimicrobiaceae bacterium]
MTRPTTRLAPPRPDLRIGDQWTYRIEDRLRRAQFEERRRVVAIDAETFTCEQQSDAPGYASGRWIYTREWNLLSRPALAAPGDTEEDAGRWVWTPAFPLFRFPLVKGDREAGEARVANAVTGTSNLHRYEREVLGRFLLRAPSESLRPSLAPTGAQPSSGLPTRKIAVWRVRYVARVEVEGSDPPLAWVNEEHYDYAPSVNAVYAMTHRVTGPDGAITRDASSVLVRHSRG